MNTVFVDRESAYPNRYRVIPESGDAYHVVLERDDEPVTPGTPLNAETFNGIFDEIDATKAPAGYGLGVPSLDTEFINTVAKLDALRVNRWFIFTGGAADPVVVSGGSITYAWGRIDTYNDNNLKMTLCPYAPSDLRTYKCELVRYLIDGVWQPWEWINPPMIPGVEYRTTERWNGKAVYTTMVNFGALPNNTSKVVSPAIIAKTIVGLSGSMLDGATGCDLFSHSNVTGHRVDVMASSINVTVTTNADLSSKTAYVTIKYIKD